jgi:hypothetical protein
VAAPRCADRQGICSPLESRCNQSPSKQGHTSMNSHSSMYTVICQTSDTFRTSPRFFTIKEIFFNLFQLLQKHGRGIGLAIRIIETSDFVSLVRFFFKKPHCPKLGRTCLTSDTSYNLPSLSEYQGFTPYFGHFQSFKKKFKSVCLVWLLFFIKKSFYISINIHKCHNLQVNLTVCRVKVDNNDESQGKVYW